MHYRNGREAKNGDKIIQLTSDTGEVVSFGILFDAVPGNDFCNGSIAPTTYGGQITGACLCDCLHMEDFTSMLLEKGLDKRP